MKALILSLPRSMSCWTAMFLSRPECPFFHDPPGFSGVEGMEWGSYGVVSTGLAPAYYETPFDVEHLWVLRRNPLRVLESMYDCGIRGAWRFDVVCQISEALDGLRLVGAESISVDSSGIPEWSDLYGSIHGIRPSKEYVEQCLRMNVQDHRLVKGRFSEALEEQGVK